MNEPKNNPKNEPLPPLPLLGSLTAEPLTFNVHGEIDLEPFALHKKPRRCVIGTLEVAQGGSLTIVGTLDKLTAGTYLAVFTPQTGTLVLYDGTGDRLPAVLAGEVAEGFAAAYLEALEVEAEIARIADEREEPAGAYVALRGPRCLEE